MHAEQEGGRVVVKEEYKNCDTKETEEDHITDLVTHKNKTNEWDHNYIESDEMQTSDTDEENIAEKRRQHCEGAE